MFEYCRSELVPSFIRHCSPNVASALFGHNSSAGDQNEITSMPGNKGKATTQIKNGFFQVEAVPRLPSVIPLPSKADHKGI